MTPEDPSKSTTSERRQDERCALESEVRVSIDTHDLRGSASNLSRSGILFFTDGKLRVTVEVCEDGETRKLSGSLVRCERIKGDHRGWAVEFDRD